MKISIASDRASWTDALSELGEYDFTHTFDFHQISMRRGEGEPLAYVARNFEGDIQGMWPVLKRLVPSKNVFDLTSVYGYCGPLFSPQAHRQSTLENIIAAMKGSGAVSLFSRMHPLFMDGLDQSDRIGEVVAVDVGTDRDVLRRYRGSHRREIVNAHARGVTVTVETGDDAASDFYSIYHQAMIAMSAHQYYLFDADYIASIDAASDFDTFFIFANLDGQRIGAAMFIVTGSIMQYYLSGTVATFRKLAPSKVIIAEAHKLAVEMKLSSLVLGGGVGSKQDALLAFKKGFSSLTLPFQVMRRVLDEERYASLCAEAGIDTAQERFFPAYRATTA